MIALAILLALQVLLLTRIWPSRILYDMGKPYVYRWPLIGGDGLQRAPWPLGKAKWNLYLHKIVADDGPALHSHPWHWCVSLILFGSYLETRKQTEFLFPAYDRKICRPGDLNWINSYTFHTIQLADRTKPVWTLFLTSTKHGRGWQFEVDGERIDASNLGAHAREEIYKRRVAKPQ